MSDVASGSVPRSRALHAGGVLCLALFASAFVAAPYSCEGGLAAYFWSGVACLAVVVVLPFVLDRAIAFGRRVIWASALAALTVAAWFAGLFAANVRILCRLF